MLGSEATRALRSKGFKGLIIGLSANDMEDTFLAAGADFFVFKPFPCDQGPLKRELCRILYSDRGDDLA
jgi:CheY-like chemotaxis protein